MKTRKFEVPYNFDLSLIDFYADYQKYIKTIFIPIYDEDGFDTRRVYFSNTYPKNRQEYESHIKYIQSKNLPISLLLQCKITDEKIINYYINMGINSFIVKYDETAKIVRMLKKDANVIASITAKLTYSDILNLDENLYDEVVLFFPFNRNYPILKKLPKKFKYILLVNAYCSASCPATPHWEIKKAEDFYTKVHCNLLRKDNILINPEHLSLFDPYIYSYKLQGREDTSEMIKQDFLKYINAEILDINNPVEKEVFRKKYNFSSFEQVKEECFGKISPDKYQSEHIEIINENCLARYSSNKNNQWFYSSNRG